MSERITVHLDPNTSAAKLRSVADELAVYFNISVEEAQNLLSADVILLERPQAEALVSICQHLGVRGTLNKKRLKSPLAARVADNAVPLFLTVLSVVVLLAVGALMLPTLEPTEDFAADQTGQTTTETAQRLPLPEISSQQVEPTAPGELSDAQPFSIQPLGEDADDAKPDSLETPEPAPTTTPVESTATATELMTEALVTREPAARRLATQPTSQPVIEPDLFTAARDLPAAEVARLLALFPMLELRDSYGQTPLMYAAGNNSAEVIGALLEAGADVNARSRAGWTPLMYAARNSDATVTQALLAAGADLSVQNESGEVARDIALANSNVSTAGVLAVASRALSERAQQARASIQTQQETAQVATPASQVQTVQVGLTQPLPDVPGTVAIGVQRRDEQRQVLESCLNDWENCGSN